MAWVMTIIMKGDHEPIKKEEVHYARVPVHQHTFVPHDVGPKGYEAVLGAIGACFGLAQTPEPGPAIKTIGKGDHRDKEQKKIK